MEALLQVIQNAGIDPSPSTAHYALQNVDALFRGEGVPLPSTVILDYHYGIAAYKAWHSKHGDSFNRNAYRPRKRYPPTRRSDLEETMDELNMFLMHIHGITPEMAAGRRQKEIERRSGQLRKRAEAK